MEHARVVTRRWEERAPGWAPLFPEPVVTKELLPGTNDDDLSPLALIAAHAERSLWRALLEAWTLVASHVNMKDLTHAVERGSELDIDRFLLPGLSATLMTERMIPRFITTYRHGIEFAMGELRHHHKSQKQLHPTGDEPYRAAAIWAQQHAGTLITHINERQRQAVRDLIEQANREGLTPDDVAVLLRQTIGLRPDQSAAASRFRQRLQDEGVSRAQVRERTRRYQGALQRQRTRMIARTELITAANAGQMALWAEAIRMGRLPRHPYKRWIVTEDERLCVTCEALGARDPIPVDEEYLPGVLFPAAHPNCRCAVALVPDGGAVLMRGGGIIALRGVGFDPLARVAARNAVGMWAAIKNELSGASPDPGKFWSTDVVEKGVRHILGSMQGMADLNSVVNLEVGVPTNNYLGMWKDSTATLHLNHEITKDLFTLFTIGGRALTQRSEKLYGALSTVVHEGFHVLSTMEEDTYRTSRHQFLEEGLVEMRARRVAAALVFGKRPRLERLAGYRQLLNLNTAYEPFVDRLRWYERKVKPAIPGSPSIRSLHEILDPDDRQTELAESLGDYLKRFARDHYKRQEATAIAREIRGISMVRMMGAFQMGLFPDLTGLDAIGDPNMDARSFYRTIQLIRQGSLIIP